MNRYKSKKTSQEAVFNSQEKEINTLDGDTWTLVQPSIIVPAATLPKGPVVLPPSTPAPKEPPKKA